MKVLVACEFSGIVRDAFISHGHDAISCDLLPSERPGPHIQDDVLNHLSDGFDLMIAHPPCTYLAVSGARWFSGRRAEQEAALDFVRILLQAPIPRIALENPVSVISSHIRKPDQIIQPWMFGHPETKTTCLWLKNLAQLKPTLIVSGREGRVWKEPPGPERWKNRSRTLSGVADAMATQWGNEEQRRDEHRVGIQVRPDGGTEMPRVLNKRYDVIPEDAVYVGRPTKWGNPYRIGVDGDRETVVRKYEEYVHNGGTPDVSELRGKNLVCWCAPKQCHADVLLELANNKDEQK